MPLRACQAWNDQTDTESFIITASDRLTVSCSLPAAPLLAATAVEPSSHLTPEHLSPPAHQPLPCKSPLIYYHWQTGTTPHYTASNKLSTTCGIRSVSQRPLCSVVISTTLHHRHTYTQHIYIVLFLFSVVVHCYYFSQEKTWTKYSFIYWSFMPNDCTVLFCSERLLQISVIMCYYYEWEIISTRGMSLAHFSSVYI